MLGHGVPKNFQKAFKEIKRAADGGYTKAIEMLRGRSMFEGNVVQITQLPDTSKYSQYSGKVGFASGTPITDNGEITVIMSEGFATDAEVFVPVNIAFVEPLAPGSISTTGSGGGGGSTATYLIGGN